MALAAGDERRVEVALPLKFADDTAILGLIKNKNEIPYRSAVSKCVEWCNTDYLQLNVNKTKEMVIDFRQKDTEIMPLKINDLIIEQVSTYKYLGVTIDEELHWGDHKKKKKKKKLSVKQTNDSILSGKWVGFKVDRTLISLFYKSVIESVLSFCITYWGGNSWKGDRIKVDMIIKISEEFTTHFPQLDELYHRMKLDKTIFISKDVGRNIRYIVFLIIRLTVLMGTKQSDAWDLFATCHTICI